MEQLARKESQEPENRQTPRYELIVRIDEPVDGSSRFVERISLSGWLLAPASAEDSAPLVPRLAVVLEDLTREMSILGAGLGSMGRELALGDGGQAAYLESCSMTKMEGLLEDPSGILSGVQFKISGIINVKRLLPGEAGAFRLLSLSLHAAVGEWRAVSNPVRFSLMPRESAFTSHGGFLAPDDGLREIHSEFLIVQGWAAKYGVELTQAEVLINGNPSGKSRLGPASAQLSAALPDAYVSDPQVAGAGSRDSYASGACMFTALLRRRDIADAGICDLQKPFALSARLRFADGTLHFLERRTLRWFPAPDPRAPLLGRIEQVGESDDGNLEISGWVLNAAMREPALRLEWTRAGVTFSPQDGEARGMTFLPRDTITSRYPTVSHAVACGFNLKVPPAVFGRMPGAISLRALDEQSGCSISLGPEAMWRVIEEERLRLADTVGAARLLDPLLREGGHLGRTISAMSQQRSSVRPGAAADAGANAAFPSRVLFATPNLSTVEGAPKVLFQVIKHICREGPGATQTLVVSAKDGALRSQLEAVGARVEVRENLSVISQTWDGYLSALREAGSLFAEFSPQLVYANVVDSFWAVDLARRLGMPSIWAIHESTSPESCFPEHDERLRLCFLHALVYAKRVLFVAEETEKVFSSVLEAGVSRVIDNGVDIAAIDSVRSKLSRDEARKVLGASSGALVVTIVGTTTRRKGQDIFLREAAILRKELLQRNNREEVRFFVVGARDSEFLTDLKLSAVKLGLGDVVSFVKETPETAPYFVASDVIVVASREESAPLVSLEAMAYEAPLVSTRVFGLAAQLTHEKNALCFDGDVEGQLAQAILRVAEDRHLRDCIVEGGRLTVKNRYSLDRILAQYRQELQTVYRGGLTY